MVREGAGRSGQGKRGALSSPGGYYPAMTQDQQPTPASAAQQLAISRYSVSAPNQQVHDLLLAQAPWANWIEQLAIADGVRWLVTVFDVDREKFTSLVAAVPSVTVQELGDSSLNGRG